MSRVLAPSPGVRISSRASSVGSGFLETGIVTVHVLALLGGGGLAVAHDRGTLRAAESDAAVRRHQLGELGAAHPLVATALGTSLASGVVLFFLHAERYLTSGVFWVKMALVTGLAVNAVVMALAERDLREGDSVAAAGWRRLCGTARTSTVLWILVVVCGVVVGQR